MIYKQLYDSKTLVLVGMGHGIDTPGKRSPVWDDGSQLFEWEFNRDVGTKFSYYLAASHISSIRFPTVDRDVPLEERSALVNELTYEYSKKYHVYLVDIHGNAYTDNSVHGVEAFTSPGTTKSDQICDVYLKELAKLGWKMRYDTSDGDLDKEERFWMLTRTVCPAILTENGFYTNEAECKRMLDPSWRRRIALHHLNAAVKTEVYSTANTLLSAMT